MKRATGFSVTILSSLMIMFFGNHVSAGISGSIYFQSILISSNSYSVDSKIYRWNGSKNAISFGNETIFNDAPTSQITTASFQDNRIYIAYQDQADSNKGKAISGIISGTSLSYGNEYTFNSTQTNHITLSSIDETGLLIGYENTNTSTGHVLIAKPSDSTLTFGNPYTMILSLWSFKQFLLSVDLIGNFLK
jgi:hypothetical protein